MQNVTFLKTVLQDRSTVEALLTAGRFLRNSALDIVAYVDFETLLRAQSDETVRQFLLQADMTEWADRRILEVMQVEDEDRIREVSEHRYLQGQLNNIAAAGGGVVLAGSNTEMIEKLRAELYSLVPNLNFIHDVLIEDSDGGIPEAAINGINEHAPALIVSRMDFGVLHKWLGKSKTMINAGIWLAIPEHLTISGGGEKCVLKRVRLNLRYAYLKRRTRS